LLTRAIQVGSVVTRKDGAHFKIIKCGKPLGQFRGLNLETEDVEDLNVADVMVPTLQLASRKTDLEDLDDEEVKRLEGLRHAVEQFELLPKRTEALARVWAEKAGCSMRNFYRLRNAYDGSLRSLHRAGSNGGRGDSRLPEESEAIVQRCINKLYEGADTKYRELVIEAVWKACDKKGIKRVSERTIRRRMKEKPPKDQAAKYGPIEAYNQHGPAAGIYKEAIAPLRVVQIDHTPLDICLVDEETDEVIGRAYLTIALDVFSRMVMGIYLSFEDPNTGSVAMCIFRSVMGKEDYMKRINVKGEWPIWGMMRTIHADNGPDFRTKELTLACSEHRIDMQWRPAKNPRYGAHIERLAKTINEKIKKLKGGIPADFKQRKHERPEKNGIFSLRDVERYLVAWITNVYHQDYHEGIGCSPLQKFQEGLYGGDRPSGVPYLPANPQQLYLDLLPSHERTVQQHGIEIDNMVYYDRCLDRFIHSRDPENSKLARKFRCRTPLDDARVIYFKNPDTHSYVKILCADRSMPPITRHQLILISKHLNKKGRANINMEAIKEGYKYLEEIYQDILNRSSKSRKAMTVLRKKAVTKTLQENSPLNPNKPSPPPVTEEYADADIPKFNVH
jgi:putative transposase